MPYENGIPLSRTPQQVLRIAYLADKDGVGGGGFYPKGMNGYEAITLRQTTRVIKKSRRAVFGGQAEGA